MDAAQGQAGLWLATLCLDLGCTVLLFRLFGRMGLYTSIVLSILLANLFGPKLIVVLGLQTSMGVIVYSSIFFATDLLSERYGRREANRAVWLGFFASMILLVMVSISLRLAPSTAPESAAFSARAHTAFSTLFDYTPRFVIGSLLSYLISQRFDVWVFHALKEWTAGRHLWLRNNLSTMASQALDTAVYSLVVWWGIVDLPTALQLGLAKYVFKLFIAAFDTPFIYWARRWDVRDRDWVSAPAPSAPMER